MLCAVCGVAGSRAPPGQRRERNAMQGVLLLLLLDLFCCPWLSVSVCVCPYALVSSASVGPVKSNPAAVEVSAKAGLGQFMQAVRQSVRSLVGKQPRGWLPRGRWDCETVCTLEGAPKERWTGQVARRGFVACRNAMQDRAGQDRAGWDGIWEKMGEMDLVCLFACVDSRSEAVRGRAGRQAGSWRRTKVGLSGKKTD